MRTRTAKKLAQRIDLHYFKRAHPLRRWRTILSIAAPALALLWLGGMAIAGSRAAYSSGPVSFSHAFAEMRCEVCHVRDTAYRAHAGDKACLTCHDAPVHASNQTAPPGCADCHREHQGRIALSTTADAFCVECHGDLRTTGAAGAVARQVRAFPAAHPGFAAARGGARDPGTIRFNHEIHLKSDLRGPAGAETLQCETCHKPDVVRVSSRRPAATGLMGPVNYEQQCARCHPLYFDERVDRVAPHGQPEPVRAFVRQSLREHIDAHPGDLTRPDGPSRRVPLNFPRVPEPPPRDAAEWVARRAARAERLLWERTCAYCHGASGLRSSDHLPVIRAASIPRQWMPKAAFDHGPHLMVECTSCHPAQQSRDTADVLMPGVAICATCHAPDKGAESRCFECHGYHDWTKAQPMKSHFKLRDFQ